MPINEEELEKVKKELEYTTLNFAMIGRIFGQPFWELLTLCLVDSKVSYEELLGILEKR